MDRRYYGWLVLCAALGLSGCGTEADAEERSLADAVAYAGRWATEPALCARDGGEDRAITIGPSSLQQGATACEMQAAQQDENVWEAELDCQGGDRDVKERVRLSLEEESADAGEVMTFTYLDREEQVVTLMRCPSPGE